MFRDLIWLVLIAAFCLFSCKREKTPPPKKYYEATTQEKLLFGNWQHKMTQIYKITHLGGDTVVETLTGSTYYNTPSVYFMNLTSDPWYGTNSYIPIGYFGNGSIGGNDSLGLFDWYAPEGANKLVAYSRTSTYNILHLSPDSLVLRGQVYATWNGDSARRVLFYNKNH